MMKRWIWRMLVALLPMASLPWAGQAEGAEILYGVTFNDELIQIDTSTGAGTLVGPFGASTGAFGLGVRDGGLYTWDQVNDRVRRLDPATGGIIGTFDITPPVDLFAEGDITFGPDGTGYISSVVGGRFVSFDLDAGTSTLIASGLPDNVDGLAFGPDGTLYGLQQNINTGSIAQLITIDPATGATSLVGSTGLSVTVSVAGLAFSETGTLFATINDTLYRVSTADASLTLVGAIGLREVSGIRFLPQGNGVIPEPSSLALVVLGAAGPGLIALRRRRSA
jgi:hypothetical protein